MSSGAFGITRYQINRRVNGAGGYRFDESEKVWPLADQLYRRVFAESEMPLAEGSYVLRGVPNGGVDTATLFDRYLGIDVTFRLQNGRKLTLQEKFLTTTYDTVTVEYMNDPSRGIRGDWFNMLAQLLFVGYVNRPAMEWRSWILLDWAAVVRKTEQGEIVWQERANRHDNAKANFLYAPMADFPEECVWASSAHLAYRRRAARREEEMARMGGLLSGQGF